MPSSLIFRGSASKKTFNEPSFTLGSVKLKPDLIVVKDDQAILIDAQVVKYSYELVFASSMKKAKYNGDDLIRAIKHLYKVMYVSILPATLT